MSEAQNSVLFICLGNICRSPIAAAVFRHILKEKGILDKWKVESAAIGGWHVGSPMDERSRRVLTSHGVDATHTARQISKSDFNNFQYIFGMDRDNIKALKSKAPTNSQARIALFGSYDPNGDTEIRDPFYLNLKDFEKCYEQCHEYSIEFLKSLNQW